MLFERFWKRTADDPVSVAIRVLVIIALIIFLIVVLLNIRPARAQPTAVAESEGVKLTLMDEPCAIPQFADTAKLKIRRTERGKSINGCYRIALWNDGAQTRRLVVAYFEGRLMIWPLDMFSPLKGV